ncbi:uncharacterized protein LOC132551530 [Ylistrum balloti]|uniref:uncharacterized protein LOC132551530 n=1 Tax=Ylistrum balloti TaxID=509963 RepID=UPI002905B353|nr:uncharacterized protein LOC132551530 [Ylistrum balloti]
MVIDTWDTGNPDRYSCTCTVTLDTKSQPSTSTTTITVQEYPGVEPLSYCGSSLHITSTISSGFSRFGCFPIPATALNNFGTTDMLNLTLSRADNSTHWKSGHCIYIKSATTTTTTTPSPTTSTTTSPSTSSSVGTASPTVSSSRGATDETTVVGLQTGGNEDKDSNIGIIAGAAGGGAALLIIVIIIVSVIIIRKRRPENKQPIVSENGSSGSRNGGPSDDMQPYANTGTMKRYVNEDKDTITHNLLYESAGPRDPQENHIVTRTGDLYAQVQKPVKHSTVDPDETQNLELEESPKGDVYAVVRKSQEQPKTDVTDRCQPSRYTNPEGLVYAEVDVQDRTSRPESRVKLRPPVISPKPKLSKSENVAYAEIKTNV